MGEAICRERIEQDLRGKAQNCRVALFSSLASTNTTAKQMALQGEKEGLVVIAEHQSAGRGRMDRSFFSPDSTGLYMSLLIRRPLPAADAVRLTTAAAVATAQAIEAISGRDAKIKWVNDVYLDGKKVCGILTEGAIVPASNLLDYAVIGIGINVAPPEQGFPVDVADIATSVFPQLPSLQGIRERLAADIINQTTTLIDDLDGDEIYEQYRRRSFLLNREITIHGGQYDGCHALVLGLDRAFRLLVRLNDDGKELALDSGEVSVRSK